MPGSRSRSRSRTRTPSRSRSRTRSDRESGEFTSSDEEDYSGGDGRRDDSPPESETDFDFKSFCFCKEHSPGKMIRSCEQCSVALSVVKDKKLVSKLFGDDDTGAGPSGLKSRFNGSRCDETVPSMSLSEEVIDVARDILAKGQFKSKKSWDDVIKKFLTLPSSQHNSLMSDIKCEDIFNKLRQNRSFKNIFKYQGEIKECLKNYRISERPVLKVVETLNSQMLAVRKFGEEFGFEYPETPPPRTGANVPRDVRVTPNNLSMSSSADAIPRPSMTKLFESLDFALSKKDRELIIDNLENYRLGVGKQIVKFYNSVSESLNVIEDNVCSSFFSTSMLSLIKFNFSSSSTSSCTVIATLL